MDYGIMEMIEMTNEDENFQPIEDLEEEIPAFDIIDIQVYKWGAINQFYKVIVYRILQNDGTYKVDKIEFNVDELEYNRHWRAKDV